METLKLIPFTTGAKFIGGLLDDYYGKIKISRPTEISDSDFQKYLEECRKTCESDCPLNRTKFCGGINNSGETNVGSDGKEIVPDFFQRKHTPCTTRVNMAIQM
jgi:hypothetical protein